MPTRYIHSPTALLSVKDAENSVKITVAAIQKFQDTFTLLRRTK
ncbi:MAG: hypothetical protein OEZ21_11775 [Candidatus Bathyarchaeota archaeon]|nr:hypothetical protein [Candidatus Bathyarchaeota archaeon]